MIATLATLAKPFMRSGVARPNSWVLDWLRGSDGSSNDISVNERAAIGYAAYGECVRIIAETAAILPFHVFERLKPKGKQRAEGHRIDDLISKRPNPHMTASTFWSAIVGHAASTGNGYAWIKIDNRLNMPLQLIILDSLRMEVVISDDGTRRHYKYTQTNGTPRNFSDQNLIHITGFGFDGYQGYSPARTYAETLGIGLMSRRHTVKFLQQGMRPSGILEHPQTLKAEAEKNIRESFKKITQGPENSGEVVLLQEGMKLTQWAMTNQDAELIELMRWGVEEVIRMFRMPPRKVHLAQREGTKTDIEADNQQFVDDVAVPWSVRIAQEVTRKLLPGEEDFFAEYNLDALVRGDIEKRFGAHAIARQNAIRTTNEIRAIENLNPVDGGDVLIVPMNMTTLEAVRDLENLKTNEEPGGAQNTAGETGPRNDPPDRSLTADDIVNFQLPQIRDAFTRLSRLEVDKIKRGKRREGELAGMWLNEFCAEHEHTVRTTLDPMVAAVLFLASKMGDDEPGSTYDACSALLDGIVGRHMRWIKEGAQLQSTALSSHFKSHWQEADRTVDDLRAAINKMGVK